MRACLFDLDGTLIDSIELILDSYRHALDVHGCPQPDREASIAGLGTPLAAQFARFTDDPREIAAMIATYRAHNLEHHDQLVKPYPGALEAVQALARSGIELAIVTSKRAETARRGLALCGFDGIFDVLIGVEEVTKHKPDPEPVLAALSRLGAEARSATFVGDSPHDLAAGRAAGVRTAAALWGPFSRAVLARERPDIWLETPSDMAALGN